MAEVVGLVASIGALAGAGFKLANVISTLSDGWTVAHEQIKAISTDTRAVAVILHQIKKRLEHTTAPSSPPGALNKQVLGILEDMVSVCQADIDEIEKSLLPLLASEGARMMFKQKVMWLLAKSKISTRRASLESIKGTLNLFLHAWDLMWDDGLGDYLEEEVKQLMAKPRSVKKLFMEAERIDQTLEKAFEGCENPMSQALESQEVLTITSSEQTLVETDVAIRDLKLATKTPVDDKFSMAQKSSQTNLEDMSDDHFLVIADHMRLDRDVTSMALVALRRQHPADAANLTTAAAGTTATTGTTSPAADVPKNEQRPNLPGATYSEHVDDLSKPEAEAGKASFSTPKLPRASYRGHSKYLSKSGAKTKRKSSSTPKDTGPLPFQANWMPPGYTSKSDSDSEQVSTTNGAAETEKDAGSDVASNMSRGAWSEMHYPKHAVAASPSISDSSDDQPRRNPFEEPRQRHYGPMYDEPYPYTVYSEAYRDRSRSDSAHIPDSSPPPRRRAPRKANPEVDPEKFKLEAELAALKMLQAQKEEEEKRRNFELEMRRRIEEEYKTREQTRDKAMEEAKMELERAKAGAERTAREKLEAERKQEAEKAKAHAEMMARVQREAREKYEAEARAVEERRRREEHARAEAEASVLRKFDEKLRADAAAKAFAEKKVAEEAEARKKWEEGVLKQKKGLRRFL